MKKSIDRSGQRTTVWFVVGFLVVATVVTIIAAVKSTGGNYGGDGAPAPAIAAGDHVLGPQDAPVSLIEYGDFQCPACASYKSMVDRLVQEYGDRIVFVSRNFPLYSIHPNAGPAAQAAEAAGLQGKYWEMYDILYESQSEWAGTSSSRVREAHFDGYAESIGLDMEQFGRDYSSDQVLKKIREDVAGANAIGVNSTPSFYVNLEKIRNPATYEQFRSIVEDALDVNESEGPDVPDV